MGRLPRITAVQLLRALRRDGWQQVRQSGSHATFRHPVKLGSVTVPRHAGVIIKPKTQTKQTIRYLRITTILQSSLNPILK